MDLITIEQRAKMLENGRQSAKGVTIALAPIVKLFTPNANATWLLTKLDPSEPDIAFGLGYPELGNVRLTELQTVRGRLGLPVERDRWFTGKAPLFAYADAAHAAEHIVAAPTLEVVS